MQRMSSPTTAGTLGELRRVLDAEGISNFGAMLSRLAIPWLAALVLDATPLEMAMLLWADVAAAALGALVLGAWVERRGKREVMVWCDGARSLVLVALALLAWQGRATMVVLALAAAANGMLTMAFEVARSAWMARRLAAGQRIEGNARLSMVGSLSETAAFALGGWLFQWLGAVVAMAGMRCTPCTTRRCGKPARRPIRWRVPTRPSASAARQPRSPARWRVASSATPSARAARSCCGPCCWE
jgi:MFS family permease